MKSEALQYLESHLAVGRINIPEFSALHDLLALFNRLARLIRRTYAGDIDWQTGSRLIAEDAADATKHLHWFHQMYFHTARECQSTAASRGVLHPSNYSDGHWARTEGFDFEKDIERLPGTKELFERISAHFDDNIYHPFLESHRRRPDHQIWELEPELTAVYVAMNEIYSIVSTAADAAGQIARKLAEYHRTCDESGEGLEMGGPSNENRGSFWTSKAGLALLHPPPPAASTNTARKNTSCHPYSVGPSFSAIEEAVNRRPVAAKAKYTAHGPEDEDNTLPRPGTMARRIERVVPRVFTGSFSELEENMRKLRAPTKETSPTTQITMKGPDTVAEESATTPVSCATPSSAHTSPGLRRREALIEHDVEFQDRIINGDVIRSRRPEECELAGGAGVQFKEDAVFKDETLTRWLKEPSEDERKVSPLKAREQNAV